MGIDDTPNLLSPVPTSCPLTILLVSTSYTHELRMNKCTNMFHLRLK